MLAEKTVLLPVSTDEAFALITEPDRLRRWKTVSARVDLRAGGAYRWTVVPGHVAAGTFIEVDPGRRIVFGRIRSPSTRASMARAIASWAATGRRAMKWRRRASKCCRRAPSRNSPERA